MLMYKPLMMQTIIYHHLPYMHWILSQTVSLISSISQILQWFILMLLSISSSARITKRLILFTHEGLRGMYVLCRLSSKKEGPCACFHSTYLLYHFLFGFFCTCLWASLAGSWRHLLNAKTILFDNFITFSFWISWFPLKNHSLLEQIKFPRILWVVTTDFSSSFFNLVLEVFSVKWLKSEDIFATLYSIFILSDYGSCEIHLIS